MVEGFTDREVSCPYCRQDVVVTVQIPNHHPRAFGIQNVIICPECGDVFKTTVFLTTKTEKIPIPKPKLELVYG